MPACWTPALNSSNSSPSKRGYRLASGWNGRLNYCDPPYYHPTRTAPKVYDHEMTEGEHRELLAVLRSSKGKVILSGYANDLYDGVLTDWNRHTFELANHAASGKTKRRMVEVLWCNF